MVISSRAHIRIVLKKVSNRLLIKNSQRLPRPMDQLYGKTLNYYKRAVESICADNRALVDSLGAGGKLNMNGLEKISRCQSLIPYIRPDHKTNFLSIMPISLYTQDDPVLRFVPSMKIDRPAAITWYDDTVIGLQPMCMEDAVDHLFLGTSEGTEDEKMTYLRRIGRKTHSIPQRRAMEDLFCAICRMFDCGIHETTTHRLLRFNEEDGCRCITDRIESLYSSTGKLGGRSNGQSKILGDEEMETLKTFSKMLRFLDDDTQSDFTLQNTGEIEGAVEDETEKGYFLKLKDNFHESVHNETVEKGKIVKYLKNSFFKPCITKKMMRVKCRAFLNCKEIKGKKIPTKKCKASQRPIISTEYYEPCTHEGATCSKKKCDCTSRGVACEISCACISCNNMRFCSCAECGDDCPCYTFNRECSDLCGCAKKTVEVFGMKRQEVLPKSTCTFIEKQRISLLKLNTFQEMKALACKNRNIQRRTAYKLSVCESKRHGYGLFSSGFIKKGSFVIEYTGEIISDKESERRGNFYEINKCSYLFNLVNRNGESLYSIDAYYGGNASRYINHSKNGANLKSEVILCEGRPHIMFYSLRDIYGGEELLFDYHFTEAHKKEHGIID